MQLADYVTVLRRRWWAIMLVVAATAVGAYIFSKLQTPVWRSEASFLVVPNRADQGLAILLQNSMDSYRVTALAPIQLEQISQQLKLDRDADWMLEHVRIQAQPDTRLMIVQADYPEEVDSGTAQRLADAVGNNMVALVSAQNQSIEGTDRINLRVNQPARPAIRWRPQTKINVLAGCILGLVLGLLLALALELFDDSLKSASEVERFVGLPILGSIPTVD